MSPFEFIFSLFGLLQGLSLTEIMGGFGRTVKAREKIRLGWLTPLLGLLVAVELTSAWATAWTARDAIPFSVLSLMVALLITGVYYLAATQVFPDQIQEWPNLDDYYDRHKRWVVTGLLVGQILLMFAQAALRVDPWPGWFMKATTIVWWALLAALLLVKNRNANIWLLVAVLALDLGIVLANAFNDPFQDNR